MVMNSIPLAIRSVLADALVDTLDVAAPGVLEIRKADETVLVTLTLASPAAFGDAASGTATANAIASNTASATGDAAICAFKNGADTISWKGTVTATGGGGDIELNDVAITTGQTVEITSVTVTMPSGS